MSWSFTLIGKPQDVAAKMREEDFARYVPEGLKRLTDDLAEKCDLPETRMLLVESSGHVDHRQDGKMAWGSFTLKVGTTDIVQPKPEAAPQS